MKNFTNNKMSIPAKLFKIACLGLTASSIAFLVTFGSPAAIALASFMILGALIQDLVEVSSLKKKYEDPKNQDTKTFLVGLAIVGGVIGNGLVAALAYGVIANTTVATVMASMIGIIALAALLFLCCVCCIPLAEIGSEGERSSWSGLPSLNIFNSSLSNNGQAQLLQNINV